MELERAKGTGEGLEELGGMARVQSYLCRGHRCITGGFSGQVRMRTHCS